MKKSRSDLELERIAAGMKHNREIERYQFNAISGKLNLRIGNRWMVVNDKEELARIASRKIRDQFKF